MLDSNLRKTLESQGVADGRLLVAVSGGRDSMVLLDLLRGVTGSLHLELVVGHVNHGLRGEDSDADEAFVAETAESSALDFAARSVDPTAERSLQSSRNRPSLEEAARNLRRAALRAMAGETDCRWVATAHHAGDQAETVLLRLLRGTGPAGLAGMAPISGDGRWIKPLLRAMPEEVASWAEAHHVRWREDASNQDRHFSRNRLRHDWIPKLAETFNPQLLRTLGNLADAERKDLEWIEGIVRVAAEERIQVEPSGIRMVIDGWDELPEALGIRLVRFAFLAMGLERDITRAHLQRVLEFLRRGREAGRDKRIELPRGIVLRRVDEAFTLRADSAHDGFPVPENATLPERH